MVTLDVPAVLAAAASLITIGLGLIALYAKLRSWIQQVAQPAQQAAKQLRTTTGATVAELVEGLSADVASLKQRVSVNYDIATAARDKAMSAYTLAKSTSDRLDRHLVEHD